jgi:thiamine kinase-like enzyme
MIEDKPNLAFVESRINENITSYERIDKGHLNVKYILTTNKYNRYVLKIYSDRTNISKEFSSMMRADTEYRALKLCKKNGLLAPIPIFLANNTVLMSYIEGETLQQSDVKHQEKIDLIVKWLANFHHINRDKSFFIINPLKACLDNLRWNIEHRNTNSLVLKIYKIAKQIPKYNVDKDSTFIHGDPTFNNWIFYNGKVYGLDFEFCGLNRSTFDLGMLLATLFERVNFDKNQCQGIKNNVLFTYNSMAQVEKKINLYIFIGLVLTGTNVPSQKRRKKILIEATKYFDKIQ